MRSLSLVVAYLNFFVAVFVLLAGREPLAVVAMLSAAGVLLAVAGDPQRLKRPLLDKRDRVPQQGGG